MKKQYNTPQATTITLVIEGVMLSMSKQCRTDMTCTSEGEQTTSQWSYDSPWDND